MPIIDAFLTTVKKVLGWEYWMNKWHLTTYNLACLFAWNSEGIWLSGKTLDCRPRNCEFDPRSLQLKLLKGDMYWFFPGKMLLCISASGHVKEPGLSCVMGAPLPNGQSPSASLNKSNTPPPVESLSICCYIILDY